MRVSYIWRLASREGEFCYHCHTHTTHSRIKSIKKLLINKISGGHIYSVRRLYTSILYILCVYHSTAVAYIQYIVSAPLLQQQKSKTPPGTGRGRVSETSKSVLRYCYLILKFCTNIISRYYYKTTNCTGIESGQIIIWII